MTWTEVADRLAGARTYWLGSTTTSGAPHAAPVWGVVTGETLHLYSERSTVKARNLAADPRCTLTTDDARNPVVLDGVASRVAEPGPIGEFVAAVNEKYAAGLTVDFQDPAVNGTFVVTPHRVIALTDGDFTGSPTRWTFPTT